MIFSVPMRIAPKATISPQLPDATAEIVEATNAWLKYRIKQNSKVVKDPVLIGATLDARM